MKRTLYRQIVNASHRKGGGLVNVLVVFPAQAFADAPYWSPGPEFEICIPNHTWFKDNRDGTVDVIATQVAPKIGIAAWNNGEWTEPEVWRVRVPAGHRWLSTALWDKPNRITYFLKGGEDEKEGPVPPESPIASIPTKLFLNTGTIFRSSGILRCGV